MRFYAVLWACALWTVLGSGDRRASCAHFLTSKKPSKDEHHAVSSLKHALLRQVKDMAQAVSESKGADVAAMVQVGAHLGNMNPGDPYGRLTLEAKMRTILVEPQPHVYGRLVQHIEDQGISRIKVLNAAVCEEAKAGSNVTFYSISPKVDPASGRVEGGRGFPLWASQIASLNKEHIMKHAPWIPNVQDYIVEIQVPCTSVRAILENYRIPPSDLLVLSIDAEGYDLKILSSIDLSVNKPLLLVFETIHVDLHEVAATLRNLTGLHGYHCFRDRENAYLYGGEGGWGGDWTNFSAVVQGEFAKYCVGSTCRQQYDFY